MVKIALPGGKSLQAVSFVLKSIINATCRGHQEQVNLMALI